MTDDRLPEDPFSWPRWGAFADASFLWEVLEGMSAAEAGRAVWALDVEDLRFLVLERLLFGRFGFGSDASVAIERPDPPDGEER